MLPRNSSLSCTPLLSRSVDLLGLYRRAAAVSEPGLRLVLEENAQTLVALISDLRASFVPSSPRTRSALTFRRGRWQRHALSGLMHLTGNREHAWITLLARRESMLLQAFERAAQDSLAVDACVLRRQLPRLYALHLDMHSLAGPTAG